MTSHVFFDVPSQHGLNVFLLEFSLHNQLVATIQIPRGSQLGEQKGQQMFGLTMQHFGDFREIDECGFFGAHFHHLWWAHDEFLFLAHDGIRIFVLDDVVHSLEELIVGIIPVVVGPSRSIFLFLCKNQKISVFVIFSPE